MPIRPPGLSLLIAWFVTLLVVLPLAACDRSAATPKSPTSGESKLGPTHVVRGLIEGLPVKDKPSSQFYVHHEAIPDWLRPDGTKGMNSMVMAFPLADGVSLDGLSTGDTVEITVVQYPGSKVPYRAVKVSKLPTGTTLNFGKAPPSARNSPTVDLPESKPESKQEPKPQPPVGG